MRTSVKWMAFGAGVGFATAFARAMVGNAAGVVAAVLSDFEARRTDVPLHLVTSGRTTRTTSTKLPPRLQADIGYVRAAAADRTIDLAEAPASVPG